MSMKIMITEEKKEKLGEYTEKVLRYAGMMMSCIEHLDDESSDEDDDAMGERYGSRMGMRGYDEAERYGRSYGYGERRSRGRNGRYM